MFVAKDTRGMIVNVLDKKCERGDYFCTVCQGKVFLRKGKKVRTHFAHESLKNCLFSFENESPEHLNNKEELYKWLKKDSEVQVEYPIPAIKQIADLFVNRKLALEIQCSNLSQKILQERSEGYRSNGNQVLWLLGKKLWLKERLTRLQYDFLYFSQNMGFFAWELDQEKKVLRLKYLLHQDLRGKLHYKIKEFPFGQGKLLEIFRFPFKQKNVTSLIVSQDKDICHYIRKQLYYQNPLWMKRQAEAYQRGENLLTYDLKDWYPQIKPIEGNNFCQINQNLIPYYKNFQAYYQLMPKDDCQKLYPPAYYQQYFSKNMVE